MNRTARITGLLIAGDDSVDVAGELTYHSSLMLGIPRRFRGELTAGGQEVLAMVGRPLTLRVLAIDGWAVEIDLAAELVAGSEREGDDESVIVGVKSARIER